MFKKIGKVNWFELFEKVIFAAVFAAMIIHITVWLFTPAHYEPTGSSDPEMAWRLTK